MDTHMRLTPPVLNMHGAAVEGGKGAHLHFLLDLLAVVLKGPSTEPGSCGPSHKHQV